MERIKYFVEYGKYRKKIKQKRTLNLELWVDFNLKENAALVA